MQEFEQGCWQSFDHEIVLQVLGIYPREKLLFSLLPNAVGPLVTNDWCIRYVNCLDNSEIFDI